MRLASFLLSDSLTNMLLWTIPPSPASCRWRGTFWDGTSYNWFCLLCPFGNCPSSESRTFESKANFNPGIGITKSDCIGKGLHRFVQDSSIGDLVNHSLSEWHFYFSVFKALPSCRRHKRPSDFDQTNAKKDKGKRKWFSHLVTLMTIPDKLRMLNWRLVTDSRRVTWTAIAILAMFI